MTIFFFYSFVVMDLVNVVLQKILTIFLVMISIKENWIVLLDQLWVNVMDLILAKKMIGLV
jgi:hypothetical protein